MNIQSVNVSHDEDKFGVDGTIRAFVTCEYIVQDKKNRFSLINIFDRIFFKELPGSYPFRIFASFASVAGKHDVRITEENPEKPSAEIYSDQFAMGKDGVYTIAVQGVFDFDYYGRHYFHLYLDEKLIGTTFLDVKEPPTDE